MNNNEDFSLNKTLNQAKTNRIPNCSTSSSIDSANSSSSLESNNTNLTKQHTTTLTIGESTFHNVTSSSSSSDQFSSGYSTLKSKKDLEPDQEVDLGTTEKLHVKPTDFEFLKVIGQGR